MTQYASASLRLLESMEQGNRDYQTPSTALPDFGSPGPSDISRVNLLQSLTDYTNSRVTIASFSSSFPSTPFSGTSPFSETLSPFSDGTLPRPKGFGLPVISMRAPDRPSMTSKHMLLGSEGYLTHSSTLSTPVTYDQDTEVFASNLNSNTYEDLGESSSTVCPSSLSTACPSSVSVATVRHVPKLEDKRLSRSIQGLQRNGSRRDTGQVEGHHGLRQEERPQMRVPETLQITVDPWESHAHNTAFCQAIAKAALTDLSSGLTDNSNGGKLPRVRPLGGSSSFRHRLEVRPAIPRRLSLQRDPLYASYRTSQPPLLPPIKPARQVSTRTEDLLVPDSPLGSTNSPSSPRDRQPGLLSKTKSLLRARFGSRGSKKKPADPDKSKTL